MEADVSQPGRKIQIIQLSACLDIKEILHLNVQYNICNIDHFIDDNPPYVTVLSVDCFNKS